MNQAPHEPSTLGLVRDLALLSALLAPILRAQDDPGAPPNQAEADAIKTARAFVFVALESCPDQGVFAAVVVAGRLPISVATVPGPGGAATLPDKKEPGPDPAGPKQRVYRPEWGNPIVLDPQLIATAHPVILMAFIAGETAHQSTQTRTNEVGTPVDDPPEAPAPRQNQTQNKDAKKASEVRAAKRGKRVLDWFLNWIETAQITLAPGERRKIEKQKTAWDNWIKENGG